MLFTGIPGDSNLESEMQGLSSTVKIRPSENERMLAFMEAISENLKANAQSFKILAEASKGNRYKGTGKGVVAVWIPIQVVVSHRGI